MGIKISALPQQTAELNNDFDFPVVDNTGPETKRVNFDVLYSSINVIPISDFDNSTGEVTLSNWGFHNASDDCGTLNSIYVPNPSNFPNKLLIIRNRNNFQIPIGNSGFIEQLDSTNLVELGAGTAYTMISNGSFWYIISQITL